ncbi:hypothetical protein K435DRAFT_853870 [Dendrothele bispora CBS 962.96]|uniref:DUF1793-domain-containing protein n=1 Tax=Dendrothele bispora (strain CBS 962.96) TaxID=1314807 RepID=A0A4V4HH53_DENBC|nr:hypothetical protein K435DRAFT_853870 [Dendrothele bispora CBS 962.96]
MDVTGNPAEALNHDWPKHWDLSQTMGWCGMAHIDNTVYQWLGLPTDSAIIIPSIKTSTITPTQTIFELEAGPMLLNISFFNPIETEDLTRQSIPFMYLSLGAQSRDNQAHEVQIYSDISAEWVTGDRDNSTVQWNTTFTSSAIFHQSYLQNPQSMVEIHNQAQDATVYYAMNLDQNTSWKTGDANITRPLFRDNGRLDNQTDTSFRVVNDQLPVFGLAVDLGPLKSTTSSLVWALGIVRDPVVKYAASPNSIENQRPYFYSDSRFSSQKIEDVIDFFIQDYESAVQRAESLDARILQDAASVSGGNDQYFNLVSMGARLVLAGFDITYSIKEGATDIKAFMKNTGIGSESNNALGLYATLPAFVYLNTTWMSYLLDSSMQFQNLLASQDNYAASTNLGNYPNATGGKIQCSAVEDTSSMLITVAAHARISKDTKIISKYYDLLKTWAEYLLERSWPPTNQETLDHVPIIKNDSTTVALKGIIGIGAMAQISAALGYSNGSEMYLHSPRISVALSQRLLPLFRIGKQKTVKSDHITIFEDEGSFALLYGLYADRLLGTNLVNQTVYGTHEHFCQTVLSLNDHPLGIPISSYIPETKSMWSMFAAATFNDNKTRDDLIKTIFARATFNQSNENFPLTYNTNDSVQSLEGASPQQGGMFALLALDVSKAIDTESLATKSRAGKIVGIVIGTVCALVLSILAGFLLWRRNKRQSQKRTALIPNVFLTGPPGIEGTTSPGPPGSERATQMRDELNTLRRELEELRAERNYEMLPPPQYTMMFFNPKIHVLKQFGTLDAHLGFEKLK